METQKKKRVLVCEFHQESNTFNPIVTGYERFLGNEHVEGIEAYHEIKTQPIAPHGMFDAIEEAGGEVIPTIFLNADSGGHVDDVVLQTMIDKVTYYIETSGEFDAVCASLHGATCTVSEDVACGAFLKKVRDRPSNQTLKSAPQKSRPSKSLITHPHNRESK